MKRLDTHVTGGLGTKIRVGDFVVYPQRQSSSMWLSYGVVSKITMKQHAWRDEEYVALTITQAKKHDQWDKDKEEWVTLDARARKTTTTCLDRVVPVDINSVELEAVELEILLSEQKRARSNGEAE